VVATFDDLERWGEAFVAFPEHLTDRLTRRGSRGQAVMDLRDLLVPIAPENGWQVTEAAGEIAAAPGLLIMADRIRQPWVRGRCPRARRDERQRYGTLGQSRPYLSPIVDALKGQLGLKARCGWTSLDLSVRVT